jgi:hypothetical protein
MAIDFTKTTNRAGYEVLAARGTRPCGTWCTHAKRDRCVCTCGGANHGIATVPAPVVGVELDPVSTAWVKRTFTWLA